MYKHILFSFDSLKKFNQITKSSQAMQARGEVGGELRFGLEIM